MRIESTPTILSERDQKIIELRKEGMTLDKIGKEVSITRERVRQILNKFAPEIDTEEIKQLREAQLIDDYHSRNLEIHRMISENWIEYQFLKFQDLAEKFGVAPWKIRQCLSRVQYVYIQANEEPNIGQIWTDEQCIQSLREAATFEFPLTVLKYRRLIDSGTVKGPTTALLLQRFGSWVNACELAGVEYGEARREYDRNWTDGELLRFVRWFMHQRSDGKWSIENFETWSKDPEVSGPSTALLRLRLGTWSQMRVLALELPLPEFNMHAFASLEARNA